MTFTIPTWLCWLIGVPLVLGILALAGFGLYMLWFWKNFRIW